MMETTAIALEGVSLRFGTSPVLSELSLQVSAGEILALLGPSGSGKSSILRLVLGFVAPERGSVRLMGETVSAQGRIMRAPEARNVAAVFQDLALWPHLTVRGNLAFGLEAKRVRREERERRIAEILDRVGLSRKAQGFPAELSGGEQQRVAIARALVLEPDAVLLDEPLSHLDVLLRRELLTTFRQLLKERAVTAIYVTHEPREAAELGDRIAVLDGGRITQTGTIAALRANPASEFVRRMLAELRSPGPDT